MNGIRLHAFEYSALRKAYSSGRRRHGVTPLVLAAAKGSLPIVKALLAAGGRANDPTDEGWTALHKAIANGHTAIVETLLESGGNLLASHASGMTPLVMAQKGNYPEIRQSSNNGQQKRRLDDARIGNREDFFLFS
ncbi:MAG: ankyrin repeat domain-containing protein [Pseudomonadota bacterium]